MGNLYDCIIRIVRSEPRNGRRFAETNIAFVDRMLDNYQEVTRMMRDGMDIKEYSFECMGTCWGLECKNDEDVYLHDVEQYDLLRDLD